MLSHVIASWWIVAAIVAAGAGSLWWAAGRWTGDRVVRRVLVGSFAARALLAIALFLMSAHGWPVFRSLHIPHGFWAFGVDARIYDMFGARIADAWLKGIELPFVDLGIEYFLVVAALYALLGAQPLFPILLNAALGAANGVLAYRMGLRLGGARAARWAAILVSCWPSSFIWSAQLLKDALSWFVVLATMLAAWALLPQEGAPEKPRSRVRAALGYARLILFVLVMTRLRFYLGSIVRLVSLLVLVPAAGFALARRRWARAAAFAGVVVAIGVTTMFARTLNMVALVSPPHPERGHFRMAVMFRRQGDLPAAEREFLAAIGLNAEYREAYLGLATVKVQQGELEQALRVYRDYLEREDPKKRQLVKQIIAHIYLEQGNRALQAGAVADAAAAHERALLFDPASSMMHVQFSQVLARQQKYEMALDMAEKAADLAATPEERRRADDARADVLVVQARLKAEEAQQKAEAILASASPSPEPGPPPAAADEAGTAAQAHTNAEEPQRQAETRLAAASRPRKPKPGPPPAAVDEAGTAAQARASVSSHEAADLVGMALAVFPLAVSEQETAAPPGAADSELAEQMTAYGAIPSSPSPMKMVQEMMPDTIAGARHDVVATGGYSVMDPSALISSPQRMAAYAPRAFLIAWLAPFPNQWFDVKGSTGGMRIIAGIEMFLLYLLVPGLVCGVWRLLRRRQADGVLLVMFGVVLSTAMALVVANLGTLFRLRLLFLLPMLVVIAAGDPAGWYRRLLARLRRVNREPGTGNRGPGSVHPDPDHGSPITDHGSRIAVG